MNGPQEAQVVPSPNLLVGLTQLLDAGGPFDTPTLFLYQANIQPTRQTVLADLVYADFHGYAAVAGLTFSGSFYDADGSALALGTAEAFIATSGGALNPQSIYGYGLANVGLTLLLAAYRFSEPQAIAQVGDAVTVVPYLRYSGN